MLKKSTWKVVEKKIAEQLNIYFNEIGMKEIARIPILGRNGPDLTVNESGLLIDVKHRLSNPKFLQMEDGQVAKVGHSLLAVKVKDIYSLAETDRIDVALRGSRLVHKYYDHMHSHSREKKYMPNGNAIPCIILHYPNHEYKDSILIIGKNDRSLLNERISSARAKHRKDTTGKDKSRARTPKADGDGEPVASAKE